MLENLGRLKTVVFDKTGTLTLAQFRIERIDRAGLERGRRHRLAAAVEQYSEHPIARLLVSHARQLGIEILPAIDFLAQPGSGATANVASMPFAWAARGRLTPPERRVPEELAVRVEAMRHGGNTLSLVAVDNEVVAVIGMRNAVEDSAQAAIDGLRHLGVGHVAMLTGDQEAAARAVAKDLSIDDFHWGLLPAEKADWIAAFGKAHGPLAMVGDGINDAPSLVAADVGVAIADIGSDVTIESANLVLMGDDLRKLPEALACGQRVLRTIRQNIIGFAVIFNLASVAAASSGWISPVTAAIVHQVSSLAVVLNSLRLLVDFHAWRHRLGDWWYDLNRWRMRIAITAAAVAIITWLASGLHVVGVGQVGMVQQFGKRVLPFERPGLHCRLPYPFARHFLIRPEETHRVEIGFRSVPSA